MSRNRIDANGRIFAKLDDYCSARGVILDTLGKPRWISTKSDDKYVLDRLKISEITPIGGSRSLAVGRLGEFTYLISSGFNLSDPPGGFMEEEVGPGHLTAILSDMPVPVIAPPYKVKEYIDFQHKATHGYDGHDHNYIRELFPEVRVFLSGSDISNAWGSFFKFCLGERSSGVMAFDSDLIDSLSALADLDPNLLPYRVMCRSIFDVDPSSFFLALYRCLESLYSYSSAQELGRRLQLDKGWKEIASTLEEVTGWYPREESSLESLLRRASPSDLERFVIAVGGRLTEGQSPSAKAAKEIYALRNAVVHYRPAHQYQDLERINWSSICVPLVGLILDVYVEAGHPL